MCGCLGVKELKDNAFKIKQTENKGRGRMGTDSQGVSTQELGLRYKTDLTVKVSKARCLQGQLS